MPIHWLDGGFEDRPTLIANTYDQFYYQGMEDLVTTTITLAEDTDDTALLVAGSAGDPLGSFSHRGKTYTLVSVEFHTTGTIKALEVQFEPLPEPA